MPRFLQHETGKEQTEPVRDNDPEYVERKFKRNEEPAREMTGSFGGPDRDDRIEVARADSGDDPRHDHPGDVLCSCLQEREGSQHQLPERWQEFNWEK